MDEDVGVLFAMLFFAFLVTHFVGTANKDNIVGKVALPMSRAIFVFMLFLFALPYLVKFLAKFGDTP